MVFYYPSYRIRLHNSHLGFGGHSKKGLGTKVMLSNTFHPQIGGQVECTIQTPEDMLRSSIIDLKGKWDEHLPLVEFAYDNSYHSSISMDPYESLNVRRCRSPIGWFEGGESSLLCPDLIYSSWRRFILKGLA